MSPFSSQAKKEDKNKKTIFIDSSLEVYTVDVGIKT
jgi:hypothetical protein